MCGIAGAFSTHLAPERLRTAVERMQQRLQHRGPDDQGVWQSPGGDAVLAHRRLSILDLSSAAHQPMSTPDGRYTIAFNGEIYNFRQLRAELEKAGVSFSSHSDTEVILRLYEREGIACVRRLRGMFAFVIWDAQERLAALARDPFGIKPLYLAEQNGSLWFASELKALRASGEIREQLDPRQLCRYFETGSVPEPGTLLREVRQLEAGSTLLWREGRSLSAQTYWSPRFDRRAPALDDAVALTRAALVDSVRAHFVSDVPVGLFLSGGLDSTALLALARHLGHEDLHTFSIGVDDTGMDESSVAARTARHFGTTHVEQQLNAATALQLFERFLNAQDQPSIDGLNTFTVAALAHAHGQKVVLSGLGGDELFGGYSSFHQVPQLAAAGRIARALLLPRLLGPVLEHSSPPKWQRIGSFLQRPATLSSAHATCRGIFCHRDARRLAAHFSGSTEAEATPAPLAEVTGPTWLDTVSELELTRYMRNQLLRDSDVMSMAHGLELRVPLVDSVLFDTVAALPASIRLRPCKQLLREAVPEMPDWVTQAPKRGFLFPYQRWMEEHWHERFASVLQGLPANTPNWYQRWAVFVFQSWSRRT